MASDRAADAITRRLLEIAEAAPPRALKSEHPDDELIALFVAGELPDDDWQSISAHLADCAECRELVAAVLSDQELKAGGAPAPPPDQRQTRRLAWSLLVTAAAVLLACGIWLWPRDGESLAYSRAHAALASGRFAEVAELVTQAGEQGLLSDRLRNLHSQAQRGVVAPISLAVAGNLSDFGFGIGGVVARDPGSMPYREGLAEAENILATAQSRSREVLLNRGHIWLTRNEPTRALEAFEEARQLGPQDPLAWLGLGLARFLSDDLAGAQQAFGQAAELDTSNVSARLNLAITLDELGRSHESLPIWRELLQADLTADLRHQIERQIESLEVSPR